MSKTIQQNMKQTYTSILIISILLCLLTTHQYGQSTIKGVVKSNNNELLIAATVFLKGKNVGTNTDLNGAYRLELEPGNYTLGVSYIGFEEKEQLISLEKGETLEVNFEMSPLDFTFKEIVVTGQLLGQSAAINRQLNADGIINSISEEQIQELPDANAAEAIGRLPGVSLRRSGGEAQKVVLRGLNDKFSLISLNGVPVPATDGNSRGVDLSMFSQSSLAGIEVSKAVTSDMDADAIAGTINLITKKAPKEEEWRVDLGGGYNRLDNSFEQYRVDIRHGQRLFQNKLGIQIAGNLERLIRSREQFGQGWTIFPDSTFEISSLSLSYRNEIRTRRGGSVLLDFESRDGGTIRFNNFFNQTGRDNHTFSRNYPVLGDVTYQITDREQITGTINNSLSGEHFFQKFTLTWGASHALSVGEQPYEHNLRFVEGGAPGTGMMNIPEEILQQQGEALIPFAYNNFESAFLNRGSFEVSENTDRDLIGYLNLARNFTLNDKISGILKVGGKYRYKKRQREVQARRAPYSVTQPKDFELLEDGSIVAADLSNTSFNDVILVGGNSVSLVNFLAKNAINRTIFDSFTLNPLIDVDLAREWYELAQNRVNETGELYEYFDDLSVADDTYTVTERISSAYFMGTLNLGAQIKVIGGLRFEREDNDYDAIYAPELSGFLTFNPDLLSDTSSSYTANYILPNLHLKYKPAKWFDLRLAATKTLSRPDFAMRLPRVAVNRTAMSIDRGNTDLKTTEAWNYDAIASFYNPKYGLLTIGGFYKALDNIFYTINNVRILSNDYANDIGLPQGFGSYVGFTLDEPINTDDTKVYGIEIDVQTNLSFLPGFLKHIVLRGNFTRIESETFFPRFRVEEDNSVFPPIQTPVQFESKDKLEGQPSNFGNVAIGYDRGGFSSRLSVFFQNDYLTSINSISLRDRSQKGFANWDLSLRQDINKVSLLFNVRNLSNFSEGQFFNYRNLDTGSSRYDIQLDFRVRINL